MKLKPLVFSVFVALLFSAHFAVTRLHAQAAPRRIEITAKRFDFSPNEITLKKGEPVVLVLTSTDVAHGLRFRDLNLNVKAGKGQTAQIAFTPEKTGDFTGQCSVFCGAGHGRMKLTLHVVE